MPLLADVIMVLKAGFGARALKKTSIRTMTFLGAALPARDPSHTFVVWGFALGAICLCATLPSDQNRSFIIAASVVLLVILLAISAIDAQFGIIPDALSIGLAVTGLGQDYIVGADSVFVRVGEASIVLIALFVFRSIYRAIRGHDGLGFGDVKLLAAGTMWVGLEATTGIIMIAVISAFVSLACRRFIVRERQPIDSISFGPHIALGIWISWTIGPVFFAFG